MGGDLIKTVAAGLVGGLGTILVAWLGLRGKKVEAKQARESSEADRFVKFNETLMEERAAMAADLQGLQKQLDALRTEVDALRRTVMEKDGVISQLMGENRQLKQLAELRAVGVTGQAAGVAAGLQDTMKPPP